MPSSEILVEVVMGAIVAFLCSCLFTTSIVLYVRWKRAGSRRNGVPKWLQYGSDVISECEQGGIGAGEWFEVCKRNYEIQVTEQQSAGVVKNARRVEGKMECEEESVGNVLLVDVSENEEAGGSIEQDFRRHDEDGTNSQRVYMDTMPDGTPICVQNTEQLVFHFDGDSTLEDCDFDRFLDQAETIPTHAPSTPKPIRPTLSLPRKSKRSRETLQPIDVNFGSMQVKGIRDVREDRPKQGY